MAEKAFLWLEDDIHNEKAAPAADPIAPARFEKAKTFLRLHMGIIIVSLLVLTLFAFKFFGSHDENNNHRLATVAAMLPIPKGDIVEDGVLRPAFISPGLLSKTQRLERLLPEDADRLVGKIRAKKDIPPNKAVLWSDLELIKPKPPASPEIKASPVFYGDKK